MDSSQRTVYPTIEPYDTGRLRVSSIHELYYEQCGNPEGNPVIFLHGGPGFGCSSRDRCFFDPIAYRIILLDQRGAGRSTPAAELRENTTWDLVGDIERLRVHLGVDRWVVFGGSWGSTLSLAYAETHPERVKALIVRGIFTMRRKELLWFYQEGTSFIFPDAWETFIEPIPLVERHDFMSAYYRRLTGEDDNERMRCAKTWSVWELSTVRFIVDPEFIKMGEDDTFCQKFARIECHYCVHGGFFSSDAQLLEQTERIRHIQTTIIQGRYDVCCPPATAWELHRRLPESDLVMVPEAGHSTKEPGIVSALIIATDKYKDL